MTYRERTRSPSPGASIFFDVLRRFEREHPAKAAHRRRATLARRIRRRHAKSLSGVSRLEPRRRRRSTASGRMRARRAVSRHVRAAGRAAADDDGRELSSGCCERDDAFPRFVDIFQRRFLACSFAPGPMRGRSPRTIGPDEDRFRAYIGAMIGVGTPPYRDADSISDFAKMEYRRAARAQGQERLAPAQLSRGPVRREGRDRRIRRLLAGASTSSERSQLGASQSRLGGDCMLGASMFSVSDKFRIRVYRRDIAQYERFLPGSDLAQRDRRRGVSLSRRGIRLGHGARHSRRRDHAGASRARARSSAGRAGWRPTGRRPTKRSARTRDFMWSAA